MYVSFLTSGEKELNHRKARVYETICVFDHSRLLVCSIRSLILAVRAVFGQDAR